jgi:sensor domain CHASE-containing protein
MDPQFLAPLIPIVAIIAFATVKIVRIRAGRLESPTADLTARLESVERGLQGLQEELTETQERLDFAERLLTKARDEPRIGS